MIITSKPITLIPKNNVTVFKYRCIIKIQNFGGIIKPTINTLKFLQLLYLM